MMIDWTITPIAATISILVAIYLYFYINTGKMVEHVLRPTKSSLAEKGADPTMGCLAFSHFSVP
jgi:hypothetical protein